MHNIESVMIVTDYSYVVLQWNKERVIDASFMVSESH